MDFLTRRRTILVRVRVRSQIATVIFKGLRRLSAYVTKRLNREGGEEEEKQRARVPAVLSMAGELLLEVCLSRSRSLWFAGVDVQYVVASADVGPGPGLWFMRGFDAGEACSTRLQRQG